MSYSIEQIEKATAECKPLVERGGGIVNADALANNPNCNKETNSQAKPNNKTAWIIGGIAVAGIAYFMFVKK